MELPNHLQQQPSAGPSPPAGKLQYFGWDVHSYEASFKSVEAELVDAVEKIIDEMGGDRSPLVYKLTGEWTARMPMQSLGGRCLWAMLAASPLVQGAATSPMTTTVDLDVRDPTLPSVSPYRLLLATMYVCERTKSRDALAAALEEIGLTCIQGRTYRLGWLFLSCYRSTKPDDIAHLQ